MFRYEKCQSIIITIHNYLFAFYDATFFNFISILQQSKFVFNFSSQIATYTAFFWA